MELRVLRYFLAVAKEQSFTKAAGTTAYNPAHPFQTAGGAGGGAWSCAF